MLFLKLQIFPKNDVQRPIDLPHPKQVECLSEELIRHEKILRVANNLLIETITQLYFEFLVLVVTALL